MIEDDFVLFNFWPENFMWPLTLLVIHTDNGFEMSK